jgi:glutathione reductase (NADPH)
MSNFDYDLFVIGGGSGGVRAARLAAGLGKKVAIAEEYRLGGTCVIRGCVPKKLFVYASQFSEHFEDARGFGWQVGESSFDWPTLIANKDREIDRLEGLYRRGLENAGAEIISIARRTDRPQLGADQGDRAGGQRRADPDRRGWQRQSACGIARP